MPDIVPPCLEMTHSKTTECAFNRPYWSIVSFHLTRSGSESWNSLGLIALSFERRRCRYG
jgi:hypothetical protein